MLNAKSLKNSICGCNVKRKYRNRKLKKYHIKGLLDKVNYNALTIIPIGAYAMKRLRMLIRLKKGD